MSAYIVTGCFILFDVITGVLKSIYKKNIDSTFLRKGLFHKLSEIVALAGCGLLELGIMYVPLRIDLPLLNIASVYICYMELISIIENLCEINPKLFNLFKPYLAKIKKEVEDNDSKDI